MARLIIIKKISEKNDIHYYAVYVNESQDEIAYYMGIDQKRKKILFFSNNYFNHAVCIYDLLADKFEMQDSEIKPKIGSYVIIKAIQALQTNHFPEYISWQS